MPEIEKSELFKTSKKPRSTNTKFSRERSRGITPSRRLVRPFKTTSTNIPAYATLDLVGSDAKVTEVSSLGEKINAEGYQIGEQAITPSIQQKNVIDTSPSAKPWKGVEGGCRYLSSKTFRDDLFSWKVKGGKASYTTAEGNELDYLTLENGSGYKLIPSTDTYAYAQQFIQLSKLMRNTQATYLPIAQASLNLLDIDALVQDVVDKNETSVKFEGYCKVKGISARVMAEALNCDTADLMIYIFLMMADKDWSYLADMVERYVDAVYNNVSILRQKYWNHRSIIDRMVQYTKRNGKTKPIELIIQKLQTKTYVSENFHNSALSEFNKFQSKRSGFSKPLMTQFLEYSKIHAINYDLTGGSQGVVLSKFQNPILSGYAGYNTISSYRYIESEESFDFHSMLVQYIIQEDLQSIFNLVDTFIEFCETTIVQMDSKYGALDSLLLTLSSSLGLKTVSINVDMKEDREIPIYSTLFESMAFSSTVRTVGSTNVPSGWYYSEKTDKNVVKTNYAPKAHFIMEPNVRHDPAVGLLIRCPVNEEGEIPTILQRNMAYRNIPMDKWDDDIFNNYASGTITTSFIAYSANEPMLLYYDTTVNSGYYAITYDQFVNWLKATFYTGTITYKLPATTLMIDFVSSYLYIDTTVALIPNKVEVYNYGTLANPLVKMSAELLLR